ncbi:MAG: hypothetical protein BM564_05165 [Bacteroidetes bacterium MedPE-SWsnd-G2]|nr:MAG: hypothetical protein BM564_05165 [Bacteroidetes bacterium MedPE-SWsnd-G2]
MKILYSVLAICFLFLGCQEKEPKKVAKAKKVYDLYQPSEMALLMDSMYKYNMQLKEEIMKGKIPEHMPMEFLKIHSAEFTKGKSRNETFNSFSKLFLQQQETIYDTTSTLSVSDRFNATVNVCVACHTTECTGPIPKINKLLIK